MAAQQVFLKTLVQSIPNIVETTGSMDQVVVSGVTADSRVVQPGFVFVAVPGGTADGHNYIAKAVAQGAAAVVGSRPVEGLPVPYIQVDHSRLALANLAAAWYGFPSHDLTLIGVTGTDGKTTTSNLIYRILMQAGIPTGMISTVNAVIGQQVVDTGFHVTTPEAVDVQNYLSQMRTAGLSHAILETTSHGLAQQRVAACAFDIAVLTNITHEHLDEHGSWEAYRDAKASLFTGLAQRPPKANGLPPLAVLNADDRAYEYLRSVVTVKQVAYSLAPGADLWADGITHAPDGLHFTARIGETAVPVHCQIMGTFNVLNCLAALAATVVGLGVEPAVAAAGIATLPGVPGRMEIIDLGQDFLAVVDFAHTPNALLQALKTAREMTTGRVIAVFGSAGLRDKEKRRMMAEVSAQGSDLTILTAEDPRTESLDGILEEMARGAVGKGGLEGQTFLRVADRGDAIRQAVRLARPGDLVIACGKGHEQSMCFETTEYAWDDRTAMRAALAELLGVAGPAMPFLPTQRRG